MKKKFIIGIMGPGKSAAPADLEEAFKLGKKLAQANCWVLTGGRNIGVMEAALKGAKSVGGSTIGILPSEDGKDASEYVDIPIRTGIGSARNNINVLSSDVIVAIGIGAGTASEIALAIKASKPVVLLHPSHETINFFEQFSYPKMTFADTAEEAFQQIENLLPF